MQETSDRLTHGIISPSAASMHIPLSPGCQDVIALFDITQALIERDPSAEGIISGKTALTYGCFLDRCEAFSSSYFVSADNASYFAAIIHISHTAHTGGDVKPLAVSLHIGRRRQH
jgi:hypothetical protein